MDQAMKIALAAAILAASSTIALSAQPRVIEGVPRIIDGDTIEIDDVKIRFLDIDTDEPGTEAGDAATDALKELIKGESVSCEYSSYDRYGRALATCRSRHAAGYTWEDATLNYLMVRGGYAIQYLKYSKDERIQKAMLTAMNHCLGVWKAKLPWCYR